MSSREIAIGDVHGCAAALASLLQEIKPQPHDLFVFLGDYVDRGPDSRRVIDLVLELGKTCTVKALMGNHELMMLAALQGGSIANWLSCGGRETLASYGKHLSDIPNKHRKFLAGLQPHFETDTHIFVHANYWPSLPMEEQPEYLRYWEHLGMIPAPHISGKTVVVGHTPQATGEILNAGHLVAIDTFCAGGGWLTALEVNTMQLWQADRQGNLRQE